MIKKFELLNKSLENQDLKSFEAEASHIYSDLILTDLVDLHLSEYEYNPAQAVEELGLDEELIQELIEDYVSQIIKSLVPFEKKLQILQESKNNDKTLDYTSLRELAHKNLGVARNLRIKNAEILLYELMKKEDLQYLILCLDALEVASIKLNPQRAYNTLKLIQVKKLFNI